MDPDLAWRLEAGAPEHGRPVDGVEPRDVLADHVEIGRPVPSERFRIVREPGARDVVDQRVVPDVDRAGFRVPRAILALRSLAILPDRERDSPGRTRARDREVLESLANEAEHLVAAIVGLHGPRILDVPAFEALLVGGQAKEPVLLGQPLERHVGVVRAAPPAGGLEEIAGRLEPLVRAVPAFIGPEVDVAVGMCPADHLLGRAHVIRIGRSDEPIGGDPKRRLGRCEQVDLFVDEGLRRHPLLSRSLGDVDRVFVRPGQEPRVVALHPVPARDHIRADDLIQRVQARLVVGVRDGRGQIEGGAIAHRSAMVSAARGAGRSRGGCR